MSWCRPWLAAAVLVASPLANAMAPGQHAHLQQILDEFNRHAAFPLPQLSSGQLRNLAGGDVVRLLDQPDADGAFRAVGMLVVDVTQRDVWVATQDVHFTATEELTELRLSRDEATGAAVWYGHADLPSPVKDRHWLVDVWNNHDLAAKSAGTAWEHAWRLRPGGVAMAESRADAGDIGPVTGDAFRDSIETPVNEGAWVTIALPDGRVLLAYHATTVVGGSIPTGLFSRFVLMGMSRMLRGVEQRARDVVPGHYKAGHEPLPAGGPGMTPFYE